MSGVRVLVGTRKGAFVLTADGTRERWDVAGPQFAGWEIYHVAGSPADPDRLYASQSTGWFGQQIQRSQDGGATWEQVGNRFEYDGVPGTHQWYDGTPHPWEFARVWHLEPSPTDPDTVYAGVEDAALFRSQDGGQEWQELPGLRGHGSGPSWQPGAGGMCLHTILLDPTDPQRIFVAISAAGAFRSDDGGASWQPINRGLRSEGIPDPDAEVGHCVHRIAMHPSRPDVLFMQKHWDVMRSDDARRLLARDQRRPAERLRLPDRGAPARAGHRLRRADHQRLLPLPAGRPAAGLPEPDRRRRLGAAHRGPAAGALLRERAARRDGRRLAGGVRASTSAPPAARSTPRPTPGTAGRRSSGTCRPCCRSRSRRCRDRPETVRVRLPAHLRTLARIDGEVQLEVTGPLTTRSVLDALEARYPGLRGTIRDAGTLAAPAVRPVLRLRARTSRTSRRTRRCRRRSAPGPSRCSSSARWPA